MKRALTTLAYSGLVALGLTFVSPPAQASAFSTANAAANPVAAEQAAASDLVEVSHRRRHWDGHHRWHRHRDWDRHRYWRHRGPRAGFFFEFGTGSFRYGPSYHVRPPYYYRPRYVVPRPAYGLSQAHVNWCYARYRSYRPYDNSFQPYNGPRRACISPYM
ncbi:BA14K family protein [Chelativorans sp.]|uniref:BA14K family protein n=1 Tax=Chelativorans sp. TaxID=2203393 RepID=UPI002810EE8B|nr:BA14K family protein [Chelativorans sp.]